MQAIGPVFGAMLQQFEGAARLLGLEPGIWKILTQPKRQITVSCPVLMDSGEIEVFIGARVVAVMDWKGGVYNERGLDVEDLLAHTRERKTVAGYAKGEPIDRDRFFGLDVDVLIPAALENQITMANAGEIRARLIVEGANGPTAPDAHRRLHERGVFVVPDILANAGGVTTSYFEWVQDRHGYFWAEQDVNARLERKMCETFDEVLQTALRYRVDMRTAAYIVAIDPVASVTRMRGMYA